MIKLVLWNLLKIPNMLGKVPGKMLMKNAVFELKATTTRGGN